MKLKNNWKRFWILNRHHAAGFTLVELIVVIAILAILAGVAIPVYSGYIKKAEDAAVITKLDALQTAVQAANATGATAVSEITVEGTVVTVTGVSATDFDANIALFYDNEKAGETIATNNNVCTFNLATAILGGSYTEGAKWTSSGWEVN